ncbi:MAG: 23S rRNA (uracil(1939)-C(5))-methyltransferase RlmD [bacterium]|nr:23S rRNA (uracil(1939)-C(5))-methyltransferase RlmD [bacterium]
MPDDRAHLTVDRLAAGGRGIARAEDGRVWFLPRAVPGDVVVATVERDRGRYVEGRVVDLERASDARREAPCPVQDRCGGCPLMTLDEDLQREAKTEFVRDALVRIGKVENPPVEPLRSASASFEYRNRVEVVIGDDGSGTLVVGLHAEGAGGVVDVERCLLQPSPANAVLATVRETVARLEAETASVLLQRADLRVVIRTSGANGKILVALRHSGGAFPAAAQFAKAIADAHTDVLAGVVSIGTRPGQRGGSRTRTLVGRDTLDDVIGGLRFRLPASTFVQVSHAAVPVLCDLVENMAGRVRGKNVLDLYAGVGLFGIRLARHGGARVGGCDADTEAIACGIATLRREKIVGVELTHAPVARFLGQLSERTEFETIVANPPRAGLGANVVRRLARLRARRIVLISCDPATLARDVRALGESAWTLERVVPVDVFPQTAHVESVALLTRRAG